MRPIELAVATSAKAPPQNHTLQWHEIIKEASAHRQAGSFEDWGKKDVLDLAKDGPCFMLGPVLRDGGSKTKANMKACHVLTCDFDELAEEALMNALGALSPYEHVWYTTHKHNPDTHLWRVRVILPLAEPIEPARFLEAWDRLQLLVKGSNDTHTRNVNRLNYFPSSPEPARCGLHHHNVGAWLRVEDLPALPEGYDPSAGKAKKASAGAAQGDEVDLAFLKKKLSRTGKELGVLWRLVLKGEAFAQTGGRHEAFRDLTWDLAKREPGLSDEHLSQLFTASLAVMRAEDPSCEGLDAIISAYRSGVDKRLEAKKEKVATGGLKAEAKQRQGDDRYSPEELSTIAAAQKCTVDELARRWIVQARNSYWFLTVTGNYSRGHDQSEFDLGARDYLAKAPFDTWYVTSTGSVRRRAAKELVAEHGSVAHEVYSDLRTLTSVLKVRTTHNEFYEAVRPIDIESLSATEHPDVHAWLLSMAGEKADKLLDWMAWFPLLDTSIAALYLSRAKGSGKTLLANGLAQLWRAAPTPIRALLKDFQGGLVRCPLVLADETLPETWAGGDITGLLRALVTDKQRQINQKYLKESDLLGSARLILAANDEKMLRTKGAHNEDALKAIAERFLYIEVQPEAEVIFGTMSQEQIDFWADQAIAEHCLWLCANRDVKKEGRLAVQGDISQMTRRLVMGNEYGSLLLDFLVNYLLEPEKAERTTKGSIRRMKGNLYITAGCFVDFWKEYLPNTRAEPAMLKIVDALQGIVAGKRVSLKWQGTTKKYRVVKPDLLHMWALERDVDPAILTTVLNDPEQGDGEVMEPEQGSFENAAGF